MEPMFDWVGKVLDTTDHHKQLAVQHLSDWIPPVDAM
jgi:hypothetical protein